MTIVESFYISLIIICKILHEFLKTAKDMLKNYYDCVKKKCLKHKNKSCVNELTVSFNYVSLIM